LTFTEDTSCRRLKRSTELTLKSCGYNGYKGGKMSQREKLVIVGGSAGGPSAAARAKRANPDLEVLMFEQGRFVSYGS
jgi:hypothetical protein